MIVSWSPKATWTLDLQALVAEFRAQGAIDGVDLCLHLPDDPRQNATMWVDSHPTPEEVAEVKSEDYLIYGVSVLDLAQGLRKAAGYAES